MIAGMCTGQLDSLLDLRYTYDPMGNITAIQDYKMGSPQTQAFTYDDVYRLTSAQASGGNEGAGNYAQESYTYDPTTGNLASKAGAGYTYGAQSAGCAVPSQSRAHAVVQAGADKFYCYDQNGNMTRRTLGGAVYNLAYDSENHMTQVSGAAGAAFKYSGDGARVIATEGTTTTVFIGNYFEWTGTITDTVKYYYAGGVRVAMRQGNGEPLFLLSDHLGSTSKIVQENGTPLATGGVRLYKAWGELRHQPSGELATKYRYTGQFDHQSIGLYYYRARWYDSYITHFSQPDSIIPDPYNILAWNRYAYARSNPLKYSDPSGHSPVCDEQGADPSCGADLSISQVAKLYGISFHGKGWTYQRYQAVLRAAWYIGNAFMDILGAGNVYEAFTQLFGKSIPFVIEKSEGNGCFITSCGKNTDFTPELIAHELGHQYANDRGNQPYSDLEGAQVFDEFGDFVFGSINGDYQRTTNGYKSGGVPDMYHGPKNWTDWNSNANNVARNEDWADMFMNWVFNNFASSSGGSGRYNWMNNWMTTNLAQ